MRALQKGAFFLSVFGQLAFASYKVDFGILNVLGHLYGAAAFYFSIGQHLPPR